MPLFTRPPGPHATPASSLSWEPIASNPNLRGWMYSDPEELAMTADPTAGELAAAAFRLDNDAVAAVNHSRLIGPSRDDKWSPSFDLGGSIERVADQYNEDEIDLLMETTSDRNFAATERYIASRREDEQLLGQQGFWANLGYRGLAGMTSVSSVAVAPLGIYRAGLTGVKAVSSALGRGAATGAVYEGTLQVADPLRTTGESVAGIAGATVMGGALGGILAKNAARKTASELIQRTTRDVYENAGKGEAEAMIDAAADVQGVYLRSEHNELVEIIEPNPKIQVDPKDIEVPPVEIILPDRPELVLRQVPELVDADGNVIREAAEELVPNDIPMPDRPLLTPTQSTGAAQVMDGDLYDPVWLRQHEKTTSEQRVPLQETVAAAEQAIPDTWRATARDLLEQVGVLETEARDAKRIAKNMDKRKDTPENVEARRVATINREQADAKLAETQAKYDEAMNRITAEVDKGAKGSRKQLRLLDLADIAARTAHAKEYTGLVKSGWVSAATGGIFRKLSPAKLAKTFGFTVGRSDTSWSPGARILLSDNPEAKVMYEKLANNELLLNKNVPREGWRGSAAKRSVESARNIDVERAAVQSRRVLKDAWRKFVKARGTGRPTPFKEFADFKKAVGRGLNDPSKVEDQNVLEAVTALREMMQTVEDKLVQMELIPHKFKVDGEDELLSPSQNTKRLNKAFKEGVTPAKATKVAAIPKGDTMYVPRIWNRNVIGRNGHEFQEHIRQQLWENVDRHKVERLPLHEQAAKKEQLARLRTEQVQDFHDTIIYSGHGNVDTTIYQQPAKTMHFKDRSMPIEREWMEGTEFLVDDAQMILDQYARSVLPQMRVLETFGGTDISLAHIYAAIDRRFTMNIEDAKAVAKTEGRSESYINRMAQNMNLEGKRRIADLDHILMKTLGMNPMRSKTPRIEQAIRIAKTWNMITKLGGMLISAFPDPGLIAMRHGLMKTSAGVWRYAAKHTKALATGQYKVTRQQYEDMAIVFDTKLNTTIERIANTDEYGQGGLLDESMSIGTQGFSKAVGMTHWNQTWKEIAADMVSLDTKRLLMGQGKKIKQLLMERGFTADRVDILRTVVSQEGALYENGTPNWTHAAWTPEARDDWSRMLKEAADTAIITPGAGDMPVSMHGQLGQLFYQFASFPMTVMNKAVAPMIQRGDPWSKSTAAMATVLPLAALSHLVKESLAGREVDWTDPETQYRVIVDRTGLLGFYSNLLEHGDTITDYKARLGVGEPSTFWQRQSATQDIVGPSGRLASDIVGTLQGVTSGEPLTKSQWRNVRGLAPFQNAWWYKAYERGTE